MIDLIMRLLAAICINLNVLLLKGSTRLVHSFHRWLHSGLQHLKKIVMGSSADLVCICMKYALEWSHLGQVSVWMK